MSRKTTISAATLLLAIIGLSSAIAQSTNISAGSGTVSLTNGVTTNVTVLSGTVSLGAGTLYGTGSNANPYTYAGNISGNLTINSGATVQAGSVWGLGYKTNASVTAITVNGGTLAFGETNNTSGGTAARTITLNGGTIKAYGAATNSVNAATAAFDWYEGGPLDATTNNGWGFAIGLGTTNNPVLATVASSTTSVVSVGINIRLGTTNNSLVISNAAGTTASGIDLIISGSLQTDANLVNDAFASITKTGAGVTLLSGSNNYNGTTTISQGLIAIGNNAAFSTNAVNINGGGIETFSGNTNTLVNTLSLTNALVNIQANSSLTVGAINLNGNTTITLDGINSVFKSTGAVTISGTNNVINLEATYPAGTYTLISGSALKGSVSSLIYKGTTSKYSIKASASAVTLTVLK